MTPSDRAAASVGASRTSVPAGPDADLLVRTDGGVRTLTINRPRVRNALTVSLRQELHRQLALADDDQQVRSIVITGAGDHFCAGADLNEMRRPKGPEEAYDYLTQIVQPIFTRMRQLGKPVVARVDGVAAGAGMFLALGCDVVIASTRARFIASQVRVGVPPDWGAAWLLPRSIGLMRTKALLLTGRPIDAPTAQQYGLITEAVDHAELDDVVHGYCADFARIPRLALAATRRAVDRAFESTVQPYLDWEAATAALMVLTPEHRQRVEEFFADRPRRRDGASGVPGGGSTEGGSTEGGSTEGASDAEPVS